MKKVKTTEEIHNVPEGETGQKVDLDGQVGYKFDVDKNKHVTLSWNYIKNHRQYFSITKTTSD